MKIAAFSLLSLLSLSSAVVFADIKPGASETEVRATLGAPRGQTLLGDREIFYYDRGQVEMRAGAVTRVSLRSAEEQATLEARRAADAIRIRDEQDILRAKLTAEGEQLKARKLADPAFQNLPTSYQVAFWEDFSRRYSDVPSSQLLSEARLKLTAETAEARTKNEEAKRMADLEARVVIAEAEARSARQDAVSFYPRTYYSSEHWSRVNEPRPEYAKPVTHMYEFPLPYATSPGMPPMQPVYRKDPTPVYVNPLDNTNAVDDEAPRGSNNQSNSRHEQGNSRRF
jgi:hypothetical protein